MTEVSSGLVQFFFTNASAVPQFPEPQSPRASSSFLGELGHTEPRGSPADRRPQGSVTGGHGVVPSRHHGLGGAWEKQRQRDE